MLGLVASAVSAVPMPCSMCMSVCVVALLTRALRLVVRLIDAQRLLQSDGGGR